MQTLRRHMFFVDGLGAVASTLATAFLLPALQPWIGLPRWVLIALAVPAAAFAVYSLSCWQLRARTRPWLPVVMVGNLAYCALVVLTVAWFVDVVTPLGFAYFAGEMAIVLGVVALEGQVVRADGSEVASTA